VLEDWLSPERWLAVARATGDWIVANHIVLSNQWQLRVVGV
jgi:hypothetical protein